MGACAECRGGNTVRMGPAGFEPLSKKAEREEDRTVLLMLGRDDLVLSAYLNKSTVPSDIDTATSRNRASLRVRYFSRVIEGMAIVDGRQPSVMCALSN